ncbi:trimeric intracellular cation channel family protein [Jeotgalibaca ciconiae]|uniref:Trimeric intracellular cation channel family protein n=1 Tax=Jeotgalibaca ciconiae TaxID=2496265 RepID=A0A3Q9BJ43_9LACT|nr:trimeric intracellular cation channel family protein [Jeotgalibaca ciconiae]AZP03554.1 trimeric intracellular cation channel family protein [Jeotgalibaca ciconiae]HJB22907.1 trimeric intracellular cation channel family protein [Candidatus Jeotgalibaca pullicola]
MTWEILSIIGTIAFAISGTLIAIEEDFDLFGFYILGFTTAFGGGLIRNLLIGVPVQNIWMQSSLFKIAFFVITLVFFLPNIWKGHLRSSIVFFDAVGLAAFAIQGANFAMSFDAPLISVTLAAILTGSGGGMLRDIFAGRRPMIFHSEIYAIWAASAGLAIGLGLIKTSFLTYLLLTIIVLLRVASVHFDWNLPRYFYR